MGKVKFVMTTHDDEDNFSYLSRMGGGGATVAITEKALVIGIWDKNLQMSNNVAQNGGECSGLVERVAKFMKTQSF